MFLFLLMSFALLTSETTTIEAATNPDIGNQSSSPYSYLYGNGYWPTSSIREWLNSEAGQGKVIYTNEPPDTQRVGSWAYDQEAGFLSNFTTAEKYGIAVTERRNFVYSTMGSVATDGGSGNPARFDGLVPSDNLHIASPDIDKNWKSFGYQVMKEKVFLLGTNELFEYVQKRGYETQKGLSPQAMKRYNISSSSYSYATSSPNFSNSNSEAIWGMNTNGYATSITLPTAMGIAPAIHLKPDYRLSNGKKASELQIGESVSFGRYDGGNISWRVINKTPEGFPLLWAEDSITIKRYDAPGDKHLRNSVGINFPTADISIKDDLKFTNGTNDIETPYLRVVDDSNLHKRQNDSFSMTIEAIDAGSGIDYIILPDGNRVKNNQVTYLFTQNKRYYFTAVDKSGNHYGFEVPVGNINPSASVMISPSVNGWTNEDVQVDIKTNQANTDWYVNYSKLTSQSGPGNTFPNYTTYAGKRFKVKGNVRLVYKKNDNHNAVVRFQYDVIVPFGNNYRVQKTYPTPAAVPIKDLSTDTYTPFDIVYTVPGSYYGNMYPYLSITHGNIEKGDYSVEFKDVSVELLDKEDFSIEKIILPTGKEILQDQYVDTLSEDGTYTYRVLDSRGKTTEKSVTVKIDKVKPTLEITGNPTAYTNDTVVLNVKGLDDRSGIKRIKKPNGEWDNRAEFTYNIYENGSYTFTAEDNAGNQTSKTIVVSLRDTEPPTGTISGSPVAWTNQNVVLSVQGSDDLSGVNQIKLPDNSLVSGNKATYTVTGNGTYRFTLYDKAGNSQAISVKVDKIDKTTPLLSVTDLPTEWTNQDIALCIRGSDDNSGISRIGLPNGAIVAAEAASYVVRENGDYTFSVWDTAGNKTNKTIHVNRIDKGSPSQSTVEITVG